MTEVVRHSIQLRELQDDLPAIGSLVARRAAQIVVDVMMGRTVIIEEQIATIGDEVIIEETLLEAKAPA